jgi:hypothetical protein
MVDTGAQEASVLPVSHQEAQSSPLAKLLAKLQEVNQTKEDININSLLSDLEKPYLAGLALSLKDQNDQLRTPESKELQKEEGLIFNLRMADTKANQVMVEAQKQTSQEQVSQLFQGQDPQTLAKIILSYYLDTWSRHWKEDRDYNECFSSENAYLRGVYLPLVHNGVLIPDVYLDKNAVHDITTTRQTQRFALSHLPEYSFPLSAKILPKQGLQISLGNEQIGEFPVSKI